MSADPVSWLLIVPGWKVVDSGGEDLGSVDEVTGDVEVDIFDGLAVVARLLGQPRYVPAEVVGTITEGCVRLQIDRAAFERLGEYGVPPSSEEILPDQASRVTRLEGRLVRGEHDRPQRVSFFRRLYVLMLGRRRGDG